MDVPPAEDDAEVGGVPGEEHLQADRLALGCAWSQRSAAYVHGAAVPDVRGGGVLHPAVVHAAGGVHGCVVHWGFDCDEGRKNREGNKERMFGSVPLCGWELSGC